MASWAYECRPCSGSRELWLVSSALVDELPPEVNILRVKTGSGWACATVDRGRAVQAEAMLLRQAVASDAQDCPECASAATPSAAPDDAAAAAPRQASAQVQAAAIALQGQRMLVVLVGLPVMQSPGEAAMLSDDLRARLGGTPIVLMAQHDDGTPQFHGDPTLVQLLVDVPIDRMPWKNYPLG